MIEVYQAAAWVAAQGKLDLRVTRTANTVRVEFSQGDKHMAHAFVKDALEYHREREGSALVLQWVQKELQEIADKLAEH